VLTRPLYHRVIYQGTISKIQNAAIFRMFNWLCSCRWKNISACFSVPCVLKLWPLLLRFCWRQRSTCFDFERVLISCRYSHLPEHRVNRMYLTRPDTLPWRKTHVLRDHITFFFALRRVFVCFPQKALMDVKSSPTCA
jgi:hypothetical protein